MEKACTKPSEVKLVLPSLNLAEIERAAIVLALNQCQGNRARAAKALGIHDRTLRRKLQVILGTECQVEPLSANVLQ